jgi:hypothetical protein
MKPNQYIITFLTGFKRIIFAMSEEEAKILAQAEAIQDARDYQVLCINKVERQTIYECPYYKT